MELGTDLSYKTNQSMRVSFVLVCLFLVGCAQKESKNYLQSQEIALAQPRVYATNTIIDSLVVVSANFQMDGVEIFYTHDGSEPTKESQFYKESLDIREEGTYTFKAFHSDWKPSESVSLKLFKKGVTPERIDWVTRANPKYPDEELTSLINQKKGPLN